MNRTDTQHIVRKALSSSIWMGSVSYVSFILNFCIQLVMVRLLIPEDFGSFAFGLSAANILFIFFAWNFSMGVVQIQNAEQLFDTAFYLSLFAGLIIMVMSVLVSFFLVKHYPFSSVMVFLVLCFLQLLNGCSSIYSAFLEREINFKNNTIVKGLSTFLSGLFAILMAYKNFGVLSLVGREILSGIFLFFGMRAISSYRFGGQFSSKTAKLLLEFAYKRFFVRGLEIIYFSGPILLMGLFISTKEVGIFSQAFYLAGLPVALLAPFQQTVAFSVYSKLKMDIQKCQQAFEMVYFFSIRFLIPIGLILYIFPTEILRVLYGLKWIQAGAVLKSLSLYALFVALTMHIITFLYTIKISGIVKIYLIQIITFILLVTFLIRLIENKVIIAGLAYSISSMAGLAIGISIVRKHGVKIVLSKLFILPISLAVAIKYGWEYFINPHLEVVYRNNLLVVGLMVLVFFTLLLFIFSLERQKIFYYFVYLFRNKHFK